MESIEQINEYIETLKDDVWQLKVDYVIAKDSAAKSTGIKQLSKISMHARFRDAGFSIEWRKIVPTRKQNGKMKPILVSINKGKTNGYDIQTLESLSADWEREVTIEYEKKARDLRKALSEATSLKRKLRFAIQRQEKIKAYLDSKKTNGSSNGN